MDASYRIRRIRFVEKDLFIKVGGYNHDKKPQLKMLEITFRQFKRHYTVDVLEFVKESLDDESVKNYFEVKVIQKKTGITDTYSFDSWCRRAEPYSGILDRFNQPEIGKHIISYCHKLFEKKLYDLEKAEEERIDILVNLGMYPD
jgi:hypothetical protein